VVKQPRTTWSQDDIPSPAEAEREFAGLVRLADLFDRVREPARVPVPVALLPELGAFAMTYIHGSALSDLLNARSLLRPGALLDGVARAALSLRVLHQIESLPEQAVNLAHEAGEVLGMIDKKLGPAGLTVPASVTEALDVVPRRTVSTRQVWLHGDFTPMNILLPDERTVAPIDIQLENTGAPEHDLARFVAFTSGAMPFLIDAALPWRLRRHDPVAAHFTHSYGAGFSPAVLELSLLCQLSGRWLRLRQLARLHGRAALLPLRLQAVDAQMRMLLREGAIRLTAALA